MFAAGAPGALSAEPAGAACMPPDTISRALVDTTAASEKKSVWKMDELKKVLGEETSGFKRGIYKERKSGRVAMVCALLCPGLGQIYNEKPVKAALAAAVETFYLNQILLNRRYREREKEIRDTFPVRPRPSFEWTYHDRWVKEYWERSVDWIWWSSGAVVVILIDAYVDAHIDDMRFKVEARRVEDGVEVGLVFRY